ncbi:MAG TPA: mechanosensitive ion channel family protein [Gemmatimonadaceae bacterium]|nr:mechanosensitive ion channel family protein [Gemmatimonadaceae bacterium]
MNSLPSFARRAFDAPADLPTLLVAALFGIAIAWCVSTLVRRLAARGVRALLRDTLAPSSPAVRGPLRWLGLAAFVLTLALLIVPIFELAGLRPRTGVHLRTLAEWTFGAGLRVLLIAALAYALIRAGSLMVRRFEHELSLGTDLDALERGKRARTLGSVVRNVTTALVSGVAVLMILREFHLDIAPVLTGAGIVGLAVGFGAQALVRDIISGFFLILEDQVRVGDVAAINGTGGTVEAIHLRTIVLRDEEGTVHVFPNGGINTLANRSKEYSYYVITLGIPYDEDAARVTALLRDVGAELQADDHFGPLILEPLDVMGVESFADWSVQMKLRIKTVPLKQWEVGRELRQRILRAFDRHGIYIPMPNNPMAKRPQASDPGTPARS